MQQTQLENASTKVTTDVMSLHLSHSRRNYEYAKDIEDDIYRAVEDLA